MAIIVNSNVTNSEYQAKGSNKSTLGATSNGQAPLSRNSSYSLATGSTVSGEVVAKDGNTITLKLSNDSTISAKLSGDAEINVGSKITFEVSKANGGETTLRPLFANLTSNSAVKTALDAASLPVTESTVAFTSKMMQEGMSINIKSLQDMARTVALYPNSDPTSIVSMTKIGMPISQNNINQFTNYQNFNHQIISDANTIASGLTELIKESVTDIIMGIVDANNTGMASTNLTYDLLDLVDTKALSVLDYNPNEAQIEELDMLVTGEDASKGNLAAIGEGIKNIFGNLFGGEKLSEQSLEGAINDIDNNTVGTTKDNSNNIAINNDSTNGDNIAANNAINDTVTNIITNSSISLTREEQITLINDLNSILEMVDNKEQINHPINAGEVIDTVKNLVADYLGDNIVNDNPEGKNVSDVINNGENVNNTNQLVNNTGANNSNVPVANTPQLATPDADNLLQANKGDGPLANIDNTIIKSSDESVASRLGNLIKSDGFSKLLTDSVKAQWSLNPSDVSKDGKIEEVYERILRQSAKITELMNSIGKGDSDVARASQNVADNVDFMNQLNEFVNYVQLPLKMAGEDAHGDLYVYTKKKNLKDNDGNFSALLHLDMEHLGPMDVYVAMKDYTNVTTNFQLQSEELMDFIESHIDELTKRLTDKGYNSTVNVTKKDGNKPMSPITEEFVKDDRGTVSDKVSMMCFDVRA